jgi:hypothetical protein
VLAQQRLDVRRLRFLADASVNEVEGGGVEASGSIVE